MTKSDPLQSIRTLGLPGGLAVVRESSFSALESEYHRWRKFSKLILDDDIHGQPLCWIRYSYGLLDEREAPAHTTLYLLHNHGLFSCLTTVLLTLLSIQLDGRVLPGRISALFGMDFFKSKTDMDCFARWFLPPSEESLLTFAARRPAGDLQPAPEHFDYHGDYQRLYEETLGAAWVEDCLDAYFKPTAELSRRIEYLLNEYELLKKPTLVVCYRGTDKHIELKQDPVEVYIAKARELLGGMKSAQLLIQTDQWQVRQRFCDEFGAACRFIRELPVTRGSTVMHKSFSDRNDIDSWAETLVAMVMACSQASCLLTHTGNVGLFLALMAKRHGRRVVQLR